MTRAIIAAALATLIAVPAAQASASKPIVVSYGDLDLGTAAGRTELNARVRAAAANLCSPVLARRVDSEPSVQFHQMQYDACVGRLTDRAMARIAAAR